MEKKLKRLLRGENEGGWLWVLEKDDLLVARVGFGLFRRE
jgi:hypothetical protein